MEFEDDLFASELEDERGQGGAGGDDGQDSGKDGNNGGQNDDHENDNDGGGSNNGNDGKDDDGNEGGNEGGNGKGGNGNDDDDPGSGIDNLSGIERFLADFGIEGGMISFEDGSTEHFSKLNPEKQAEILEILAEKKAKSIEQKYDLDQKEIDFLNAYRSSGLSFEEFQQNMAKEILASTQRGSTMAIEDIKNMDPDDVYRAAIQSKNPEIGKEELEADLAEAKRLKSFETMIENMREQLITKEKSRMAEEQRKAEAERLKEIEADRQAILSVVRPMEDINGIKLDDNLKNEVLSKVLEVAEDGDSLFHDEVFSDPKRIFQAAFWYYNGPKLLEEMEKYWKKEKAAAYSRGMKKALEGAPSHPVSFSSGGNGNDDDAGGSGYEETQDDLFNP